MRSEKPDSELEDATSSSFAVRTTGWLLDVPKVLRFYLAKLRAGSRTRVILTAIIFMLVTLQVTVAVNEKTLGQVIAEGRPNNKFEDAFPSPEEREDFRTPASAFSLDDDDLSVNDPEALNVVLNDLEFSQMNLATFVGNIDTVDTELSDADGPTCADLRYHEMVGVSNKFDIGVNLKRVRELVFEAGYEALAEGEVSEKTLERKIKDHWFTFHASSVYLPEYGVHYVARRIIFSAESRSDRSTISFVVAQLFDKAWNELTQFQFKSHAEGESGLQTHLFPKVFPMDCVWGPGLYYEGAEDPRVIVRHGSKGPEPIVVFNMKAKDLDNKRAMHALFPFQNDRTILLKIEGRDARDTEKNWVPFFDAQSEDSKYPGGFIYFIYSFDPLEVIQCDLSSGNCGVIFTGPNSDTGALRGATNLVSIPGAKFADGRQAWVGFPRTRIVNCGCGDTTYRPNLMVFVKQGDQFIIDLISGSIDFNLKVMPWDGVGESCSGRYSVLIPNSVDNWEITQYLGDNYFEDYMTVTFSEADRTSSVVQVKGLLNYIRRIPEAKTPHEDLVARTAKSVQCAIGDAEDYCFKYGQRYGGRILSEDELKWGE
ncbi:unnamed protein product [Kuraishia capsulata CBS 1993]|uniref:Uncharacterized protein n=1 Tax=Kuraishia capsulata CBS 1993 TaxID=1382522 RepID=W6MMC5_9ASCO|nr:uncharacterized protein KUCA_T00003331001 [Kuraishia capsulata CBS 1993]CDK27353.1 unnamed protein product [Kuraishia capsulata CBS 1993]